MCELQPLGYLTKKKGETYVILIHFEGKGNKIFNAMQRWVSFAATHGRNYITSSSSSSSSSFSGRRFPNPNKLLYS